MLLLVSPGSNVNVPDERAWAFEPANQLDRGDAYWLALPGHVGEGPHGERGVTVTGVPQPVGGFEVDLEIRFHREADPRNGSRQRGGDDAGGGHGERATALARIGE